MLNPSGYQIVLLPQDRQLMAVLGCTETEYRAFLKYCYKKSRVQPSGPVAIEPITLSIILFVVGIVFNVAIAFLFRPRLPGRPAEIRQTSLPGQNIVNRSEYAPKAGFDSLQNVVEIGSIIPLVYAKRETIDGVTYGGVRVSTNFLWSQMLSLGGSQMLRAVFMISEGGIGEIDPSQFAFGDNVLGGYDLADANEASSRVTFYASKDGGRLKSSDRIAGRSAANDIGNAENDGGSDVFQIRGLNNEWTSDFCYAFKPSTQTQFGIYSLIGNGFGFRVNPSLRPAVQVKTEPSGNKGDTRLLCETDGVSQAQRDKFNTIFSSRGGVIKKNGVSFSGFTSFVIGDTITYFLDPASDANRIFVGVQSGPDHNETCRDVAQTVSGRQRSWDDALMIGELYRFGSAFFVCETRSPQDEIFASEVDSEPIGGGQGMAYTLRCVRNGSAILNGSDSALPATATTHLFKTAISSFALPRASQIIEIGFRSILGIRISGICNFRDSLSLSEIDGRACSYFNGRVYSPGQSLELSTYQSGSFSGSEIRYSFFKIAYRVAGSDDEFTYIDQCFGTRGLTQQATYNYIRLQMPSVQRWEFRIEPLSGWEIRSGFGYASGSLEVLDARIGGTRTVTSGAGTSLVTATYSGEPVSRTQDTFSIAATKDKGLGVALGDSGDYADAFGRLAEAFVFEEMQSSAKSPEHEITYVNLIAKNPNTPNYDNMAIIGANLRSSTELSQLSQFSIYLNEGIGSVHTFPEVLEDKLRNSRYGVGSILSPELIDEQGFSYCAQWTRNRRYFFDGGIPEPVNLRQWGSQTAGYFLLDFVTRNGKISLQPAVYFDQPEGITGFFTAGNIIEDSFEFVYAEVDQRTRKRFSIKWRQEKASDDLAAKGLFPVIREVTVREAGTPEDAPLESIDLTDFGTSEIHAIDVGKYFARISRLITHSVKFKTVPTQAALEIGRCFLLGLETVAYLQPNNGAIDSNGKITSVEPLANGTYDVMLWDGTTSSIIETRLPVVNQSTTAYTSAVFCIKQSAQETRAYKTQSIGFDEDGNIEVNAVYFPLDDKNYSLIADGWDVEENWIIEGRVGTSENTASGTSQFNGVQIVGPSSIAVNADSIYSALISGGAGAYSYSWSGPGITFGTPNAAVTSVSASSAGLKTITCTVTRDGNVKTATKTVTAVASESTSSIGVVTITGALSASVNTQLPYKLSYQGMPQATQAGSFIPGKQYQIATIGSTDFTLIGASANAVGTIFTASGSGSGSGTADSMNAAFISWSWSSNTNGAAASISNSGAPMASVTFGLAGTYALTCTVSSPAASDSPQSKTITVNVT